MFNRIAIVALFLASSFALAQQSPVVGSPVSGTGSSNASTQKAEEGAVRLKPGWVVTYVRKQFNANEPTFVFLPGIYRGFEQNEQFLQELESRKLNYVAVHFSPHIRSVKALGKDEQPIFAKGKNVTAQSLATEVEAVVDFLKLKKPFIVSISYSAIVTPYLNTKKFPFVIETAPMGAYNESNLAGSYYGQLWADWIIATTPGGAAIVEAAKDKTFYSYWGSVVSSLAVKNPDFMNPLYAERATDGFVALARASEGFELAKQDFSKGPLRTWIFGEQEDNTRAQYQKQGVEAYLSSLDSAIAETSIFGKKGVATVSQAGHIVPVEQPAQFIEALLKMVESIRKENPKF